MSNIDLIQTFFKSKKNANIILEVEKNLLSEDGSCILINLDTVQKLFTQIFEKNMLQKTSADETEREYQDWLSNRYQDFILHSQSFLSHENEEIKEKALEVLMTFVKLEYQYPLMQIKSNELSNCSLLPLFQKIILELLSESYSQQSLITKFQTYSSFNDVKYDILRVIRDVFKESKEVNDIFLTNCYYVLSLCNLSKNSSTFFIKKGATDVVFKENLYSKLFSNVWNTFLKYNLPHKLIKKILLILPKVMQNFHNPIVLTDFLTELYNEGGIISLLSLNSLFKLMQKYNVEYPDFYKKLYSLFDKEIVNGKYSSTFFFLADLFLSSTHLPAYMVAAFVKKLSTISLHCNVDSLVKLLTLVRNLLARHPSLIVLLHRDDPKDYKDDPFDESVTDPIEAKALDSSLWEIKDLEHHYDTEIVKKAKVIICFPKEEHEIQSVLDITIDSMYEKDRKRFKPDATLMETVKKSRYYLDLSVKN